MLNGVIRTIVRPRFLIASVLFGLTIISTYSVVHAYEDVPPAVPVDAVAVESLPLPEPIHAKTNAQKKSTQATDKQQASGEKNKPNALERLWKRIVTASKPSSDEKQDVWTTKNTSKESQKSQIERYLKKTLMPAKPEGGGFYVVELFTTQACPFCPKADAMMETYSSLSHVIALSCHIDYFDVEEGSLSLPICSSRQARYEALLSGQPKYTPQMVVNGRFDAVGYLPDKIAIAFKSAHKHPVEPLVVMPDFSAGSQSPGYTVELPEKESRRYQLWLVSYDEPRTLTVSSGANSGKNLVYFNTVNKAQYFGSWNGIAKEIPIDAKLPESTKGFSFLVQDAETGAIIMAGKNE